MWISSDVIQRVLRVWNDQNSLHGAESYPDVVPKGPLHVLWGCRLQPSHSDGGLKETASISTFGTLHSLDGTIPNGCSCLVTEVALSPRTMKFWQEFLKSKVMFGAFFLPCRALCTMNFFHRVLCSKRRSKGACRLWEAIHQECSSMHGIKNGHFRHKNASVHWSLLVQQQLTEYSTLIFLQPLYSRDLAPCNFYLVLWMMNWLNGCHLKKLRIRWLWSLCCRRQGTAASRNVVYNWTNTERNV